MSKLLIHSCNQTSMVRIANILLLLFAISFTPVQPLHAQDFYKGQTIQIVVGFAAGGGFDSYSRTIARHMGKHIPGNPNLVVVNTTGAGSLIAANQVYHKAKPDGLTIGNFIGGATLNQILGLPGIEFDARKFRWIGVPVSQDGACALTTASGITSVATWQASKVPVKLGASAAGNVDYNMAKILKEVIALPVQVISGYKGTAETRLAAESGEIAGSCWQWQSIKATWKGALDAGRAAPLREVDRVLDETTIPVEVIHTGNLKAAVHTVGRLKEENNLRRLIIGSDTPVGHGVIPLAIMKTLAHLCPLVGISAPVGIALATGNSARVYDLNRIGFLKAGCAADLLVVDAPKDSAGKDALGAIECGDVPAINLIVCDGRIVARRGKNTPHSYRAISIQPNSLTAAHEN